MHTFDGEREGLRVGSLWETAGFSPGDRFTLVPDASDWVLMPQQPMMLQSSVIRRETYLEVGGLWNRLPLRHDTHLFLRLGLGRAACAVSGIGVRMTDEGGEDRPTRLVTPSSRPYWDETVLLDDDVVRTTRRGTDARRVLAERAASGYWRRARLELSSRQPLAAMGSAARCIRMKPRFLLAGSRRSSRRQHFSQRSPSRADATTPAAFRRYRAAGGVPIGWADWSSLRGGAGTAARVEAVIATSPVFGSAIELFAPRVSARCGSTGLVASVLGETRQLAIGTAASRQLIAA